MNRNRFSIVLGLLLVFGAPRLAHGQAQVTGGEFRRTVIQDDTLLRAGRYEFGVNLAFLYANNQITAAAGAPNAQSTLVINPGLYAGFMVWRLLQLRAVASYLGLVSGLPGDSATQNTHAGQFALHAIGHFPLRGGYAVYAGIGPAGYYGITSRIVMAPLRVNNTTFGGGGQVFAGLLMQPGPRLNFRVGVRFDALFGVERGSAGTSDQSTQNYQGLAEFAVSIR